MLIYSSYLQDSVDWSDSEVSIGKKYLDWNELSLKFENIQLHWDEIFILLELRRGGGAQRGEIEEHPLFRIREKVGKENTDKLVKLYCRVNDIDYEKILEKRQNVRILTNDFIRFINSSINIKVEVRK